jgi:hypothetical protein
MSGKSTKPFRKCKNCGKICFGHLCRECFTMKRGTLISVLRRNRRQRNDSL